MRKRVPVTVGGGIALLLASQYFNFGLGWRSGEGGEEGTDPSAQVSVIPSQSFSEQPTVAPEPDDEQAADEQPGDETVQPESTPPDVVDVLIDGNQYLVLTAQGDTKRQAMTLDQIVTYASSAAGEPSGIRVRIARKPSAVAAAENAVIRRLTQAGLDADEIDSRRQLVE